MDAIMFLKDWTPMLLAAFALIISIKAWKKSRAIYGLERYEFAVSSGKARNPKEEEKDKKIIERLSSGRYTIVTSYKLDRNDERNCNMFVLGKIKRTWRERLKSI